MPRGKESFVKKMLQMRSLLVINLIIIFLLGLSFGKEFVRNQQINKEITELEQQAEQLEVRNLEILKLKGDLQSESYIEKEARLRLGLRKPGESVVVIPDENGVDPVLSDINRVRQEMDSSETGNPTLWWRYFFSDEEYEAR